MSAQPTGPTVYPQSTRWRRDGTLRHMHDRLRALAREAEGRAAEPSAATVDSQTVRATGGGGPARGHDPAERTAGRKRHLPVDTSGLILPAHVHAANLHDRLGARALVADAGRDGPPRVELVRGDGGAHAGTFARRLAEARGWRVEVPEHRDRQLRHHGLAEKPEGFQAIPRRLSAPLTSLRGIGRSPMVIERTSAWLSRSRRLARDHERLPETGVAMIRAAMSRLMLRRVAGS